MVQGWPVMAKLTMPLKFDLTETKQCGFRMIWNLRTSHLIECHMQNLTIKNFGMFIELKIIWRNVKFSSKDDRKGEPYLFHSTEKL